MLDWFRKRVHSISMNLKSHGDIHTYIEKLVVQYICVPMGYPVMLDTYRDVITAVHVEDNTYDLVVGASLSNIHLTDSAATLLSTPNWSYVIRQIILHFKIRTLHAPGSDVYIDQRYGYDKFRTPHSIVCKDCYVTFERNCNFIFPSRIECSDIICDALSPDALVNSVSWLLKHRKFTMVVDRFVVHGSLYMPVEIIAGMLIKYDVSSMIKNDVIFNMTSTPSCKFSRSYIDALGAGKEQTGLELDI